MQEANKFVFRVALDQQNPLILELTPQRCGQQFAAFIRANRISREEARLLKQVIEKYIDEAVQETKKQQKLQQSLAKLNSQPKQMPKFDLPLQIEQKNPPISKRDSERDERELTDSPRFKQITEEISDNDSLDYRMPAPPSPQEIGRHIQSFCNSPKSDRSPAPPHRQITAEDLLGIQKQLAPSGKSVEKPVFLENRQTTTTKKSTPHLSQSNKSTINKNKPNLSIASYSNQRLSEEPSQIRENNGDPGIFKRLFEEQTHSFKSKQQPEINTKQQMEYLQMMQRGQPSISNFQDLSKKTTASFRLKKEPIPKDSDSLISDQSPSQVGRPKIHKSPSFINRDMLKGSHCEANKIKKQLLMKKVQEKQKEKAIKYRIDHESSISPATKRQFNSRQCACCNKSSCKKVQSPAKQKIPVRKQKVFKSRPYVSGLLNEAYEEFTKQLRNY